MTTFKMLLSQFAIHPFRGFHQCPSLFGQVVHVAVTFINILFQLTQAVSHGLTMLASVFHGIGNPGNFTLHLVELLSHCPQTVANHLQPFGALANTGHQVANGIDYRLTALMHILNQLINALRCGGGFHCKIADFSGNHCKTPTMLPSTCCFNGSIE